MNWQILQKKAMFGQQLCAFPLFKFLLSAMTRMAGEQLERKKSWTRESETTRKLEQQE
jgi:hypothetical protein